MLQNAPFGAFCNTFDLHKAKTGLENKFLVFLRVAVLDRFYCISLQESFYLVYPSAIASVASCKIVQTEVSFNK